MLERGAVQLSSDELLALVLGSGTRQLPALDLARRLLTHTGGLQQLSRASPRELVAVNGVGEARATRVVAAFDLGRRALERVAAAPVVRSASAVHARLEPRLSGLRQEVFIVLALDAKNAVLEELEVARGILDAVEVHPREVFRPLVRAGAAAAVVAHNHPSGDPEPSPQDLDLTHRLRQAGELLGIPLLDHVVIAGPLYTSVAERLC